MSQGQATLSVALCQMTSVSNPALNLKQMLDLVAQVSPEAELICFPENCLSLRIQPQQPPVGLNMSNPAFATLARVAADRQVGLLLGSVPLDEGGDRLSNAMIWLAPGEPWRVVYRKIHLFDVDVAGEKAQRESKIFAAGEKPAILEFRGFRLGLSICYDLRFSELYAHYARQGCEALLVPAAFLPTTGRVHWHVLLKARAIESQAYVLAPAQAGQHLEVEGQDQEKRETYGHTLAVDPWGTVIGEATSPQPEVVEVKLQREALVRLRQAMPMAAHRRLS